MTLPIIHAAPSLQTLSNAGSWDALILVTSDDLFDVDQALTTSIDDHRSLDQSASTGVHLVPSSAAPGGRLILCCVGTLLREGDDLQLITRVAAEGMRRALSAGAQRPCLHLSIDTTILDGYPLEAATFGALSALWVPLEAREVTRGRSIEALGISTQGRADLTEEAELAEWTRWISAVEMGRFVARDVAGTEPERMAPKRLAELCKRAFKGTSVSVEVIKDRVTLERDYPLLSAVARASWVVDRHQPCVIRLRYQSPDPDGRLICLAGKGVTYDTGGADLKTGGHMAGMSRDKGGAAAVIGFMLSIAHWRPESVDFVAEIGAVRNSVGADSFVSDELIVSHAGTRVRIGNTDAEGRLVLADLLSHLRESVQDRARAHLVSVATLTGHAYRAMGSYSIAVDNDAARRESQSGFNGLRLQEHAERYGEGIAISRLRYQDFEMVRARTLCEDVLSCNNLPSTATPRGHQFPAAFLIKAAGLSNDGVARAQPDQRYRFTHLDIGGSGVEGGDWQHGRPTAAPVLGLMATLCRRSTHDS